MLRIINYITTLLLVSSLWSGSRLCAQCVTITAVSINNNQITVTGTAPLNCPSITLSGFCIVQTGNPLGNPTAPVSGGVWTITTPISGTGCTCGDSINFTARCSNNKACFQNYAQIVPCNPCPTVDFSITPNECTTTPFNTTDNQSTSSLFEFTFTPSCTAGCSSIASYSWDFGDGLSTPALAPPMVPISHRYASSTAAGGSTVTPKLTVNSAQCPPLLSETIPHALSAGDAADIQSCTIPCPCPTVSIVQSNNGCTDTFRAVVTANPCNQPLQYDWTITLAGNSSFQVASTGNPLVYVFSQPGNYTVTLSLNGLSGPNGAACVAPQPVQVNTTCGMTQPPPCPTTAISILTVTCNPNGTWTAKLQATINWQGQTPTNIQWNFGDGTPLQAQSAATNQTQFSIQHTYANCTIPKAIAVTNYLPNCPGYNYDLTTQDSAKFQLCTCPTFQVTAKPSASNSCLINFTATPTTANSCLITGSLLWTFVNSAGETIGTASGSPASFTFPSNGNYTATLSLNGVATAAGNACPPISTPITISGCNTPPTGSGTSTDCQSNCPACQGSWVCCLLYILFIAAVFAAIILLALAACQIGVPYTWVAFGIAAAAAIVLAVILIAVCHYDPCDVIIAALGAVVADYVIICGTNLIPCSSLLCRLISLPLIPLQMSPLAIATVALILATLICKLLHLT
jgi:hypothetical protein